MTTPTPRNDLPPANASNYDQRVRETIRTYLGVTGDPLNKGVTYADLVSLGLATTNTSGSSTSGGSGGVALVPVSTSSLPVTKTPPPTPTNVQVTAGISHVFIQTDPPTFTQGGGYLQTNVYGIRVNQGDPLPTFSQAAKLDEFVGHNDSIASDPATTWCIWVKWESVGLVESVEPAGGINGFQVTTGQDVSALLKALNGQITSSQLYGDLASQIDLITAPANTTGSVQNVVANATENLQQQILTMNSTLGSQVATLQVQATTAASNITGLLAEYTVKVDVNGYVSGFGLASTANNATPYSSFAIRADEFYIASPTGPGITPIIPFTVTTTPTTINGQYVPVGVYMNGAYIQNGTITNAQIGNASIDAAQITSCSVTSLTAGSISTGQYINSSSYITGTQGWTINANGYAEFQNAVIRGTVYANAGTIGGVTIASNGIHTQSAFNTGNGFWLDGYGHLSIGNGTTQSLVWDGGSLSFTGNLAAATGNFSGALNAATGTFAGTLTAGAVNAVNTINIAGNAVSVPAAAYSAGPISVGTSWVTVQSVYMNRSAGVASAVPMTGIMSYTHSNLGAPGTAHTVSVQVVRSADGATVFWGSYSAAGTWTTPYSASFQDTFQGSTYYYLQVQVASGSASAYYMALTLLETRR